jgi:BirA family biotin operon repressor/biotin-[acetyl-CoA-carboxylase] ligase
MIAALAAREAAASVTGFRPTLKWPNDVRVDGRKLCGVLAESSQGFQGLVTTIGIGLNVNMEPEAAGPLASDATSLRHLAGRMISRFDVLAALLGELDSMYADLRAGRTVYPEWRSSLETIGLEVEVSVGTPDRPERVVRGTAIDADQEGRLLVRDSEGVVWPMAAGEVTLQSANPGE